jgi:hypothetical protein
MKVKCGFGVFIKADLKTMPPLAPGINVEIKKSKGPCWLKKIL